MKRLIIFFAAFLLVCNVQAQVSQNDTLPKRNTFYFEALGQGILYSLAFDRLLSFHEKYNTSWSAGFTFIPPASNVDMLLGAQGSYNFLFGKKNHHLELGLGLNVLLDSYNLVSAAGQNEHFKDVYSYFTPKVGYRYQRPKGGVFFRVTLTPEVAFINLIHPPYNYEYFSDCIQNGRTVFLWFGASAGFTLKK
ncbi:MAG TPA: hypothetical protein VII99_03065 [Bacteroidia bacterium]